MSYLNPGDQLSAAHWNTLFAQADAELTAALGGLSAVFALVGDAGPYADKQWDRGFFFGFDPTNPPVTLHPVAFNFIKGYLGQAANSLYWRQYNHTAITGIISGLTQIANTPKWQVVKTSYPVWATWLAAVYPSGLGGGDPAQLSEYISFDPGTGLGVPPLYARSNCLDTSLQVLKQSVAGTPYNVTFADVTTADHAQPLKPIDVFILGNFTWDTANWDKYSVVRVHNCGQTAATATFGTATATLAAGACKCFRKVAGVWQVNGNYFHWMASGDGRFIQMREVTGGTASIFQPGIVADVLTNVFFGAGVYPQIAAANFGKQFDPTKFFDISPVYNNPAYTKQPKSLENTPPPGGYFPALANSDLLGDLIIPRGNVLVANRATPQVVHATMTWTCVFTVSPGGNLNFPIVPLTDGNNVVANVSNVVVTDLTTATVLEQTNPGEPGFGTNWVLNTTSTPPSLEMIPRGLYPSSGAQPDPPYMTYGDVIQITFDYIPPDDHVWVAFDSFATLAAKLTAAGLLSRALSETNPYGGTLNNLEIYSATGWHLIDLSCPLVTFLTGGNAPLPAVIVGSTQSSSPKSLKLPWLGFWATTLVNNPASTNSSYKKWVYGTANAPALGSSVNVTVNNAGSTVGSASNIFLPTDLVSTVQAWWAATSQAGGILTVGNFQIISTTFGHVLLWDEVWPLDARFTGLNNNLSYFGVGVGGARTIKVIYDAGAIKLHVTRAQYLNESRYANSYGYSNFDDLSPFENSIFPPVGNFLSHPPTSRRFMFWHYPRVDRQFQNPRWAEMLAQDSPWVPAMGWFNSKWTVYQDELSQDQFNNVISFYETAPLGVDTVGPAIPVAKTGISRMGTFSRAPDIWSPFSYWLNKIPALTFQIGYSGVISGITDSSGNDPLLPATIVTTSGWYYANTSIVMSNGAPTVVFGYVPDTTVPAPISNVLPCQMEHYNSIASLVNGLPAFEYSLIPYNAIGGGQATTFKLNFAAANIIIVNGGSGYTVGQALNFNLKVASIGAGGVITGVTQNGAVVINSYDAYSTPVRPFALAATGGATCDTSVGDGSGLCFIPQYAPIGVQTPVTGSPATPLLASQTFYGWSKIFPRTAFYSWNGATAGGADPIATYLASLGMTVQNTLPDGYGATATNVYGYYGQVNIPGVGWTTNTPGYGTHAGTSTDWMQGFNPTFQTKAQTYRWVTIAAAQTLYAAMSLPFVLNQTFAPMSFKTVQSTQDTSAVSSVNNGIIAQFAAPNPLQTYGYTSFGNSYGTGTLSVRVSYYDLTGAFTVGVIDVGVGSGAASPPGPDPYIGYVPGNLLNTVYVGGSTVAIGSPAPPGYPYGPFPGNYGGVVNYFSGEILVYQSIPPNVVTSPIYGNYGPFAIQASEFVNDAAGNWLCDSNATGIASGQFLLDTWNQLATQKTLTQTVDTVTITGSFPAGAYTIQTWYQNRVTNTVRSVDDWGILNPIKYGTQNAKLKAVTYLLQGVPSQLVAALPVNYAYADPAFVTNPANAAAYLALGAQVLPLIADNTVEGNPPTVAVFGSGDNVMTTGLNNARLVVLPIDGQISAAPVASGAGDSTTTSNGAGGGGAAGGSSGGL